MISFVINPVAGKGKAIHGVTNIEEEMRKIGIEHEVLVSQYPRHTVELARDAVQRGSDCVVAVGGDGTVTEVARELIGSQVRLGIIPRGTGNDLAKSLHIPFETDAALRVIEAGKTMPLDVGDVSGVKFFNVAGCGFDVDVVLRSRKYKNKIGGQGAYIAGVIDAVFSSTPRHMHIQAENYNHEKDILLIAVANGPSFGGGMRVAPQAQFDDGLFDVCVVRYVPRIKIPLLLPKFIKGTHLSLKECDYFKTDKLTIETPTPVLMQVDGEIMEFDKLDFSLQRHALQVVIP